MYVVIVGAGEVGTYVSQILVNEGHDVALVEADEKVARQVSSQLDALIVTGNGASPRALRDAGLQRADLFIAVTNVDEVNLFSCLAAKRLANPRTIARVRDRRYLDDSYAVSSRDLGIDDVLGPEHAVAEHIGHLYRFPGLSSYESLAEGRMVAIETSVKPSFAGVGLPLALLEIPRPGNLIAIQRQNEFIIPKGNTELSVGDQVFALTIPERVREFLTFFGAPNVAVHKVLVVGGGWIGFHTARYLEDLGHRVEIIENDPDRAQWIAQRLRRSVVHLDDATRINAVRERIHEGADAVAVLLREEEKALLIAMYAKHIGARQVISRVDDFDFAPIAYKMGIDSLLSPQRVLAQTILERVRRGGVERAMMLGDNQIEILEFTIPEERKGVTGVPIADMGLPKDCLVGGIVREGTDNPIIIPRGSDEIMAGDHVIVSVRPDVITEVEELLGSA